MTDRKKLESVPSGEAIGLKLLQAVREMKAGQAARTLIHIAQRHPEVMREVSLDS